MTAESEAAAGNGKPDVKGKLDKSLVAAIVLHLVVIGWMMLSFSTKAFVMPDEEVVAVDVISPDQLAKMAAGTKPGKREKPKPLVEKVAEAKPIDDAVGKITEKKAIVTDAAPDPVPKQAEKA